MAHKIKTELAATYSSTLHTWVTPIKGCGVGVCTVTGSISREKKKQPGGSDTDCRNVESPHEAWPSVTTHRISEDAVVRLASSDLAGSASHESTRLAVNCGNEGGSRRRLVQPPAGDILRPPQGGAAPTSRLAEPWSVWRRPGRPVPPLNR